MLEVRVFSQTTTNVSGIVTDTLYHPIEYAAIQLFSLDDSTRSYGTISTADGTFSFKNIFPGRYNLKASSIGYQTVAKTIDISQAKRNSPIGLIQLRESSYELENVEISVTRKGLREKADMLVYIPDSIALKTAKTGIDILNKIPELRFDKKDQTISVLGNKNVLILINGIDNDRNIVSIHPNDIERIEVVTHPSVKYQSDVASVINIVLKGFKEKGFTISSNLYYCLDKKYHSGNLQLDYNIGKWRFFVTYGGQFSLDRSESSTYREDNDGNFIEEYISSPLSDSKVDLTNNRFQYGFDYEINKNNLLSFTSRIVLMDLKSYRHHAVSSSTNQVLTKESIIESTYQSDKKDQNYSLYFLHKFKNKGENITINSNYYILNNQSDHHIKDSSIYYPFGSYHIARVTNGLFKQHSLNTKVDYTKPVTNSFTLESGYQFYGRKINNETIATDTEKSVISYTDYRNSLYANGSSNLKDWNFQAGVRLENFDIKFDDVKNNQTKFLPYAAIFYKPNANNSLKLTYRESLEYPVYSILNPFRYYSSDSLSYSAGNPNLKPEQKNDLTFQYSLNKKKNHFSISLYYNYLSNLIVQTATLQGNTLAYNYDNAGKARRYGSILSFSSILFNWVEFEFLLKGSYTNYMTNKAHNGYSYSAEYGITIPLFWDIDLEVFGILKEREIDYNGYFEYGGRIDEILLTREVFKNLYLGFAVWQPFTKVKDKDKQWGKSFREIENYKELRSTSYLLNLTYFFKSGKKVERENKESFMESPQDKSKRLK